MKHYIFHYIAQTIEPTQINNVPKTQLNSDTVPIILSIVFGVFGAIALLIIVLAGLRYTISQGDPQATAKAKNTIIYAVIGLIVSMAAFAIVTFVLGRL